MCGANSPGRGMGGGGCSAGDGPDAISHVSHYFLAARTTWNGGTIDGGPPLVKDEIRVT